VKVRAKIPRDINNTDNTKLRKSQSHGIICNSHAACWRWLFQTWKFWQFTCSQYDFNLFARSHYRL